MVTWADRLVLYTLVGLAVVLFAATGAGGEGAVVRVAGDAGCRVAPLSQNATFTLNGPLGKTVVVVQDGAARIASSPCPHKVCVGMGAVSGTGQAVVCVPNRVVVTVEGAGAGPADAVTR
jgi:hypothetical protein